MTGGVDPALIDRVEEEYEDTASDLLREWIEQQGGSITPENDHFTLDWGILESTSGE